MNDSIFEKEFKIKDLTDSEKKIELISNIIKVKKELDIANSNFEFAR